MNTSAVLSEVTKFATLITLETQAVMRRRQLDEQQVKQSESALPSTGDVAMSWLLQSEQEDLKSQVSQSLARLLLLLADSGGEPPSPWWLEAAEKAMFGSGDGHGNAVVEVYGRYYSVSWNNGTNGWGRTMNMIQVSAPASTIDEL